MATLIEDLQTLLAPLAAGGAWPVLNTTTPPVYPYIVVQRVGASANVAMGGPSALQNTRWQVDVWSRRIAEAETVMRSVDAAFAAWATQNAPLTSAQDLVDDQTRSYRVSKDFSIWSTN